MVFKDISQALVLLNEMNVSTQNVATLVESMIQKVKKGELSTDQGLSFLEMKYNMLLSYLINLTYVVLRKCSGEKIQGDPCIDRLIEIRTVLEKIRPIDHKLKYQIDKLVKSAISETSADDQTNFKPNPEFVGVNGLDEANSDDSDVSGEENVEKKKSGVYTIPKLSSVPYPGRQTTQENTKHQEKNKKHSLSSSIIQDLREEYLDTPMEISQGNRAQQILSKEQEQRTAYEEEYLTRLPVSKAEKRKKRHLTTMGTLGDEITQFGSDKKKKQKRLKFKGSKKRRFH